MNLATAFAVFFLKSSDPEDSREGPTDPPSSLSVGPYGTPTKARLTWTNGDATAYTRIYTDATAACPQAAGILLETVNPGITSYDTPYQIVWPPAEWDRSFALRHYKNGQESADSNCKKVDIA